MSQTPAVGNTSAAVGAFCLGFSPIPEGTRVGLVSTAAVVLRTHAYGDSSLVVKSLTDGFGIQTFMARGVRARGGKGGAAPELYSTGMLTFNHRAGREMHTLRSFEPERLRRGLTGSMVRFSGAALMAELVLRHLGAEGHTGLHRQVGDALDRLTECDEEDAAAVVVTECWKLVGALGYRPEIVACVRCTRACEEEEIGRASCRERVSKQV